MLKALEANGTSMKYVINSGDIIIYSSKYMCISPSDLIVYSDQHEHLVCHRIIWNKLGYYIVAGDNCDIFEVVSEKMIKGKVAFIIGKSGKFDLNLDSKEKWDYFKCLKCNLLLRNKIKGSGVVDKNELLKKYMEKLLFLQFKYLRRSKIV